MMDYKDTGHEEFVRNVQNVYQSIDKRVANQNYHRECGSISIGSQHLKASIYIEQKKVLLSKRCISKGNQHVSTA